ncbi:sigma-70 family RNA polymerase sigma factor [Streptomyces finlayi]|uniref:sigma-70 family RNA polymerase sigma factor n=1 Tax=Streptomyces finlayi TaxID=67296 RepID=UPI0021561A99|nr:sigma-70 family RNA polymerase sigma factor [Streptomyces finlayi]
MTPAPTPFPASVRSPVRRVPAQQRDVQITGWALAAGCGDREAAEHFVRATYDDVRRFVTYLGAEGTGADDLAQETYLRAMTGLAGFAGRSCARTWLLAIARRVVIDGYRAAAVRPRIADTADWQTAAERAQSRHTPGFDEAVALFDALRAMDSARSQAFVLTQLLGMSYEETANTAGCPIGTVRSRVARARRDLAAVWPYTDRSPVRRHSRCPVSAAAETMRPRPNESDSSAASVMTSAPRRMRTRRRPRRNSGPPAGRPASPTP